MKYEKEWQRLRKIAYKYYEGHEQEIKQETWKDQHDYIMQQLPKLKNISIWCRKGNVTYIALHCDQLSCEYKKTNSDVLNGCAKCQTFQVTKFSNEWDSAEHITL